MREADKNVGPHQLMRSLEERVVQLRKEFGRSHKKVEDYANDPEVIDILNILTQYYVLAEHVGSIVVDELIDTFTGVYITPDHQRDDYIAIEAICKGLNREGAAHIDKTGFFSEKELVNPNFPPWKPANLVYVKSKEHVDMLKDENLRKICSVCPAARKVIPQNQKAGRFRILRQEYDHILAIGEIENFLRNQDGADKWDDKMIEHIYDFSTGLGFSDPISMLERSELVPLSYYGLPERMQKGLIEARNLFIPGFSMIIGDRNKTSFVDKHLESIHLKEDSYINDFNGWRIILPTETDCYNARLRIYSNDFFIVRKKENFIKSVKDSGYQSLHLDVQLNHIQLLDRLKQIPDKDGQFKKMLLDNRFTDWIGNYIGEIQFKTNDMDTAAHNHPKQEWSLYKDIFLKGLNVKLKKKRLYTHAEILRGLVQPIYNSIVYGVSHKYVYS